MTALFVFRVTLDVGNHGPPTVVPGKVGDADHQVPALITLARSRMVSDMRAPIVSGKAFANDVYVPVGARP